MPGDETGHRRQGKLPCKLPWLHGASTGLVTLLGWHRQRGHQATAAVGVGPALLAAVQGTPLPLAAVPE